MSATSRVLLVAGGVDVMRRTFEEHGRAYWSAEFVLILEKHGWVDFATAEPEALARPDGIAGYALVIVAWLPEECWRDEYVETLRRFEGELLLEGPFPPAVEELLGIEPIGPPEAGAQGPLAFSDDACAYVAARFGESFPIGHRSGPDPSFVLSATGEPSPLELAPRQAVTRTATLDRSAYGDIAPEPVAANAGRAAVSLVVAYRARFQQNRCFFDDPVDDALALLGCARCLSALTSPGPLQDALRQLLFEAAGSNRPPAPLADERSALARSIWAVALVEAGRALDDATFAERAKEVLADTRSEWGARRAPDPILARWRMLLALELGAAAAERSRLAAVETFVPAQTAPTAVASWLDSELARRLPQNKPTVLAAGADWIDETAAELAADPPAWKRLEGLGVPELMLVLALLQRSGKTEAAQRLWRALLDDLYDPERWLFLNARVAGGELSPLRGLNISPLVALGLLDAAAQVDVPHAPLRALEENYDDAQLEAWAAPPYAFQPYAGVDEGSVVASLARSEGRQPAIWRSGRTIATSFQLLAHLVHVHTVEPLAEPFVAYRSGDAIALEYLLVHLLGSALARDRPQAVTVAPWPWDTRYALTVRHDIDRLLDKRQFTHLLEFERKRDLAVSWFWLPDRLDADQIATLEREPRHEIALHSVRLDRKSLELELLDRVASTPVSGEAIHGSGDGWLGHLSVRAAADAGLLYTELAPPIADVPYARYPWIDRSGRVGSEHIVGVTYNISIESKVGTAPGSEGGPGLYRQLLNHPDLNFDRLSNWIDHLPEGPRVEWTCEQVARWWRATHAQGSLSIRHLESENRSLLVEVSSRERLDGLELRLPCDPATVAAVTLDGADAEWETLDEPEHRGIRVRLDLEGAVLRTLEIVAAESGAH